MGIKLITDSACDLPESIIEKFHIEVMPIYVYVEGKEYLDGENITPESLYRQMMEGKEAKTAQIPVNNFIEKFEACSKTEDTYICLLFSSKLSGTYQSAVMALNQLKEEKGDLDITIVDTRSVTLGMGIIVHKAAKMIEEGKSKFQILEMVNHYIDHMEHLFTVGDLEYLCRGGRVSRAQASIGNILNIYPILHVENGALKSIDKAKGTKKLYKKMMKYIGEKGDQLEKQEVGIAYANNVAIYEFFKNEIPEKFGTEQLLTRMLGSAIGAHTGPDMIAIFFLNDYKEF